MRGAGNVQSPKGGSVEIAVEFSQPDLTDPKETAGAVPLAAFRRPDLYPLPAIVPAL